ncbi:MAG: DUF1829 domain-containing protein [Rubrobacter sp.]|nr:DUF1829 domain-containing protein [Rubrobacter sp.]
MNAGDCQALIDEYIAWLRKGLSGAELDGSCEVTTPSSIVTTTISRSTPSPIMAKSCSATTHRLGADGYGPHYPQAQADARDRAQRLRVRLSGKRLEVDATPQQVGQKMHALLLAIISVNDMFVMASSGSLRSSLRTSRLSSTSTTSLIDRVKLSGTTGFDHLLDFVILRSAEKPERLLQTINAPTRNTITSYLFALTDTVSERAAETKAFAFLNDEDSSVSTAAEDALSAHGVGPLYWTRREESLEALAG